MQSDYISRQEAIYNFKTRKDFLRQWVEKESQRRIGINIAIDVVKAMSAADVVPVVHGKWIPHSEKSREYIGTVLVHVKYDYWLCDTCGYRVENGQPMYNFCPNCGAKMDGGKS